MQNQWKKLKWSLRVPWVIKRERKKRGSNLATRIVQALYRQGGTPDVRKQIEGLVKMGGRELADLGIEKKDIKLSEYELPEEKEGKIEGGY